MVNMPPSWIHVKCQQISLAKEAKSIFTANMHSPNPLMAVLGTILMLVVTSPNPAMAISGGPFSAGSALESGSDGTYQASMNGRNFIGVATFQVSRQFGSAGRYSVFNRGIGSFGVVTADVNTLTGSVTAVLSDVFYAQLLNGDIEVFADLSVEVDPDTGFVSVEGESLNSPAGTGGFNAYAQVNAPGMPFTGTGVFTLVDVGPGVNPVTGEFRIVSTPISRTNFTVIGYRSSVQTDLTTLFSDPLTGQPLED